MKLALALEMCILAWLSVLSEQRWMVVMASRAAGDFEKVYLYIWYRMIRYMLYCICAFF